eukprot:gnl/Dysnectes_brevis/1207_a1349_2020.p1 GENE.gnl/Dysnectes_brevis/1207_a1349_2020~~gnl/Dysnectes_brevis/1207_a1349_2020.p1  ORF type:complete len:297 (+),score=58.92 gnl/Dysnectes_brevis/1207_a1349_2020:133-1023(+)
MSKNPSVYLSQHKVYEKMTHALESVIAEQPENLIDSLKQYFKKPTKYQIILCGPPACGKGTHSQIISEKLSITHIAVGTMLRKAILDPSSEIGSIAKPFVESGRLVPDHHIIEMMKLRLQEPDCSNGWLLDGFPRTQMQALAMKAEGILPSHVISIDVPDDELVARIGGRRLDPVTGATYHVEFNPPPQGEVADRCIVRADDTEDTVRNRLSVYHANDHGVTQVFSEMVVVIPASGLGIEELSSRLFATLDAPRRALFRHEVVPRGCGVVSAAEHQAIESQFSAPNSKPTVSSIIR